MPKYEAVGKKKSLVEQSRSKKSATELVKYLEHKSYKEWLGKLR